MRVLIVDDEPAARTRLAIMLEELDVEVAGEAANGLEALDDIARLRPDLLLLDIAMPEVDGFDVARRLPDPPPLIVFQTAYDEHALKAFEHAAIDYLVKPVTLDALRRAIDRARERTEPPASAPDPVLLTRLQAALVPTGGGGVRRVLARHRGGHRLLPIDTVILFYAERGVVRVRTTEKEYLTDYTLAELEERLGVAFVRPNRSELVRIDHIVAIASNGDGSATLTLSDDSTVRVSRRRAGDVREMLHR